MVNEIVLKEVNRIFECDILDPRRHPNNVSGRIAFASFLRSFSNRTVTEIGRYIGKDHATVCHYSRKHELYYQYDSEYRKKFNKLKLTQPAKRKFCCHTPLDFVRYKKTA